MSELVFLFSADADIQSAYEFYEAYQPGRGEIFMRHLDIAFGRLRLFSEMRPYFTELIEGCLCTDFYSAYSTQSRLAHDHFWRDGSAPRPKGHSAKISLTQEKGAPLFLPLDDRTRPGEPAAEDDEQHVVADLHAAGAVGFVEGDGDGGGAGVAVAVEIHHEALERQLHPVGDGFDDAEIGLVRDDAGEVLGVEIGVGERLVARRRAWR